MNTSINQCYVMPCDAKVTLLVAEATNCFTGEKIACALQVDLSLLDALRLGHALIEAATAKVAA